MRSHPALETVVSSRPLYLRPNRQFVQRRPGPPSGFRRAVTRSGKSGSSRRPRAGAGVRSCNFGGGACVPKKNSPILAYFRGPEPRAGVD